MKDLFQRLAGAGGAAGENGKPRLALAALGKHPGWDDHIPGIGVDTAALVLVKQALYGDGIGRQVDSGAWEKLEVDKRLEGFDHAFLWLQPGHAILGLLWSSTDGKGRAKYPMVLCVDGEGITPAFMMDKVLPGLERLREACKTARTSAQVTADCATAQAQLHTLEAGPATEFGPVPPLSARRTFLERPELGPDRTGLLRVLHELGHTGAGAGTGRGQDQGAPADMHPRHIRLPLVSESRTAAMLLWSAFFRCAVADAVPLLLLCRAGVDWLDVIVGEPVGEDFFCLQASPKALPLATEIPYDLSSELITRLQEIETRFLGVSAAKAATRPDPIATPVPAPLPVSTPAPSKTTGRKGWFWMGGGAIVLAGAAAILVLNGQRDSGKPHSPAPAVAALSTEKPTVAPPVAAVTPAPKGPEKIPAGPSAEDLKFEAAMKAGSAALGQGDIGTALAQAALAAGIHPDNEAAKKLMSDAQAQQKAAKAAEVQEQSYQAAIQNGNAALARKDYAGAITQAEAALGLKTNDSAAITLRNQARQQMAAAAAAEEYEKAMTAAKKAIEGKDFAEAIKQCDVALKARNGDAEAVKLKQSAQQGQKEIAAVSTTTVVPPIAPAAEKKTLSNSQGLEFVWFPNLSGGGAYVSKYEVTQKQYRSVVGKLPAGQAAEGDDLPVANVSLDEARAFCDRLGKNENKTYALPTKEDWLAAAGLSAQEAGDAWNIVIGKGWLDKEVTSWKIDPPLSRPAPVGSRGAQDNGLCDLFGNVREWLASGESAGFSYNSSVLRTKLLFLGANEASWVPRATGFRCVLHTGNSP